MKTVSVKAERDYTVSIGGDWISAKGVNAAGVCDPGSVTAQSYRKCAAKTCRHKTVGLWPGSLGLNVAVFGSLFACPLRHFDGAFY